MADLDLDFDLEQFDASSAASPLPKSPIAKQPIQHATTTEPSPDTFLFDGEKELDGMSRYISNTFSPSIFQPNTPPPSNPALLPSNWGSPSQQQQLPQQIQQQQQQQQQPQYYQPSQPMQPSMQPMQHLPPSPMNSPTPMLHTNTQDLHQARAAELSRHQQQLQDLHEFYRGELADKDREIKEIQQGDGLSSGASLSEIARLEEHLRTQATEHDLITSTLRSKLSEQKAELDDVRKHLNQTELSRSTLSEKLRENDFNSTKSEKDLQSEKDSAVRTLENQMRNSEDKLRDEIKASESR